MIIHIELMNGNLREVNWISPQGRCDVIVVKDKYSREYDDKASPMRSRSSMCRAIGNSMHICSVGAVVMSILFRLPFLVKWDVQKDALPPFSLTLRLSTERSLPIVW